MIYWLDTEFSNWGGHVLSLALVAQDGRELYLALPDQDIDLGVSDFVRKNVLPHVETANAMPTRAPRQDWPGLIKNFLSMDSAVVIYADWPDDIRIFCECLITGPGTMVQISDLLFRYKRVEGGVPTLPGETAHNALSDARSFKAAVPFG